MAVRLSLTCFLLLPLVFGRLIPMMPAGQLPGTSFHVMQPMSPMQAFPIPMEPLPARGPCPMSPYSLYLNESQQQTLAELVTEARQQGADETTVKQHIYRYIRQVLSPQRFSEFEQANERFEVQRRGKRSVMAKQVPTKVYDLLDEYNVARSAPSNDYLRLFEEDSKKIRQH